MANRRITGRSLFLGHTAYYDETGKYVGKSRPGAFGTTVYYDEKGRMIGRSRKGFLAKTVYYDAENKRYITTCDGLAGENHFESGKPIGHSTYGLFGTKFTTLEMEADDEKAWSEDDHGDQNDLPEIAEEHPIRVEAAEPTDRNTIVKNIALFVACVLVSAVILVIVTLT